MPKAVSRRELLSGITYGVAGLSTVSLLTACQKEVHGHSILVGVTSRPRMLDPRKATDALSSRVNRLIYRQLIDFNEKFEAVPDIASWQQLSPTTYLFTLNEPSYFDDGSLLTAADVVATYRSILDKSFGSPHHGSLKGIKTVEAVDSKTVKFSLNKADSLFVGRLVIGILPKALVEQGHPFHEKPVGSGGCRFVSLSEQKLVLERKHDGVQLNFIPVKDATVRVLKLKKGELDITQNDLSPELVQYCAKQKELKVDWFNGTNFGYIGFNFEDPLLAQPQLRKAIAHGIDRQAVIDALFDGQARLAGGLFVPEHWSGVADMPEYEYNPEKAKALLKQLDLSAAGQDITITDKNGQPQIELSYKTSNDPTRIRLATIYQSQLKKVGIKLNIQSYDWGTFYNDIKKGRFQLYSLAWVGVKSPDIFEYVFDSKSIPPNGANRGRYRSAEVDRIIQLAGQTEQVETQAELYKKLQHKLQQDLAAMPLWYENQYVVSRKNISGYQLYSDGRLDSLKSVIKH